MKCSYKLTPEQEAVVQKALKEGKEKYKDIEHLESVSQVFDGEKYDKEAEE